MSNEFFRLWLDPTQTYSCAYFERDDMTLEEAQLAKIDLALGKLGLQPGMTLLDVGCGWGSTMMRAIEKYDVNVIGLTLSENQKEHVEQRFRRSRTARAARRCGCRGGSSSTSPSTGSCRSARSSTSASTSYDDFFKMTYDAMPDDGVMLLHTITVPSCRRDGRTRAAADHSMCARFIKFILTEIFPGGRLPSIAKVEEHATPGRLHVTRRQSLQPHYARTLDTWAATLEAHKDEAIAVQSEEVYDRYMRYLTGCADLFRDGLHRRQPVHAGPSRHSIRRTFSRLWLTSHAASFRGCAVALRPLRRLLRAVSGSVADLQLRLLRARRHDARRGSDRQDRPGARQTRPAARYDTSRHRLRLGRHHAAGRRTLRRPCHRADAFGESA